MATSSILESIVVNDPQIIEEFVRNIEESTKSEPIYFSKSKIRIANDSEIQKMYDLCKKA